MSPRPVECTEFEVGPDGTLFLAGFDDPETRADLYPQISERWAESPLRLVQEMANCEPLAWEIQRLRDEACRAAADQDAERDDLPSDPEDAARAWLLGLDDKAYRDIVVPAVTAWLDEPPAWSSEGDFIDEGCTAQGIALQFFRDMPWHELGTLGVDIVEGEHPGSSFYGAVLRVSPDKANQAAQAAGIPVAFV